MLERATMFSRRPDHRPQLIDQAIADNRQASPGQTELILVQVSFRSAANIPLSATTLQGGPNISDLSSRLPRRAVGASQLACAKLREKRHGKNRPGCKARRADRQTLAQPGRAGKPIPKMTERRRRGTKPTVLPVSSRANSGFPTTLLSKTTTYAAFFGESRTRFTETTKPDRKSGGSRGTCCAPFSQTKAPANELATLPPRLFLWYLGYFNMQWLSSDDLATRCSL
jgi:hypothetical protein